MGLVKAAQKLAPDRVPRVVPDTVLVGQKSGAGHGPGLLRGPYKRLLKSDAGQGPKRNGPGGGHNFQKVAPDTVPASCVGLIKAFQKLAPDTVQKVAPDTVLGGSRKSDQKPRNLAVIPSDHCQISWILIKNQEK